MKNLSLEQLIYYNELKAKQKQLSNRYKIQSLPAIVYTLSGIGFTASVSYICDNSTYSFYVGGISALLISKHIIKKIIQPYLTYKRLDKKLKHLEEDI